MDEGDVSIALCRKETDPTFPFVTKVDKAGAAYTLHWLKGRPGDAMPEHSFKLVEPAADVERADITVLHAVYTDLLEALVLDAEDKAELLRRGLTEEDIATIGYKSYPTGRAHRAETMTKLMVSYKVETLLSVPGFTKAARNAEDVSMDDVAGEGDTVELMGGSGYFLPWRTEEGKIFCIQMRGREGGNSKYCFLSSPRGGSKALLGVHVPQGFKASEDGKVAVTEGYHKAEIASRRLGYIVLGLPSITMIDLALPLLSSFEAVHIELALDADTREKPTCAAPIRRAASRLASAGYDFSVLSWPTDRGKGLDDVLCRRKLTTDADDWTASACISSLSGRTLWTWIKDISRTAKLPADVLGDALIEARIRVATMMAGVEKDPMIAYRDENVNALAMMDKGSVEVVKLIERLKAALPKKFGSFNEKLEEARKTADSKKRKVKAIQAGKMSFALGSHVELATALVAHLGLDHKGASNRKYLVHDMGSMHRYSHDRHVWEVVTHSECSRVVQAWDGSPVISSDEPLRISKPTVSGAIELAQDQVDKPGFFTSGALGLAFSNGFLKLNASDELVLEPHSTENRVLVSYDFDYDPNSPDPTEWINGFKTVWAGDEDLNDKIDYVQEFHGTLLMGDCPRQKFITIFWGPKGNNGKSSVIAGIKATMPEGSTCAIKPKDFTDRFRLAEMAGKIGNFVDELPGKDLLDGETIKSIATGKVAIQVERKNKDPFEFMPRAGHLWGCNSLVSANEMDEAFFARFLVLRFNLQFTKENEVKNLWENMARDHKAAIINWAIRGYARLLKNKLKYTIPASAAEAVEKWKKDANPTTRFIDECLVSFSKDAVKAKREKLSDLSTIYRIYESWSKDGNAQKLLLKNTFANKLADLGHLYRTSTERGYLLKVRPLQVVSDPGDDVLIEDLIPSPENILEIPCLPRDENSVYMLLPDGRSFAEDKATLGASYRGKYALMVRDGEDYKPWAASI